MTLRHSHAGDDGDDGGGGGEADKCVMIAVDNADLRCRPSRYDCHTDSASAINTLAVNAADVAGLITPCHHQQQQVLDDITQPSDVTLHDDVTSSSSSSDSHHDVSNDAEAVEKSLTSPDTDSDDVIRVTSRHVGDGRCDDVDDDVTVDEAGKVCVHLSELAVESQSAKETETFLRELMWQIAMKRLRQDDWQKLAKQLHFTDEHIRAISCQYTGLYIHRSVCLCVCLNVRAPAIQL